MKLVVDSGSTKTDWGFFNTVYDLKAVKTQGINPCHQSEEEIRSIIRNELLPNTQNLDLAAITEVFYYGAGCATQSICEQMAALLKEFIPNAAIAVDSDMLGAARALCGHAEGVACVLGTGSNSCLYNGKAIEDQVPSLGYILGDEGSSAALGRRLIGDCLKRQLPEAVSREFMERYSLTKESIIESVYRKPLPNRFIAGFAPFVYEKRAIPEVHKMIIQCFSEFFTRNVINYHKPWLPVHFVGSLAGSFADELRETADSLGMTIGKIEASPMSGLVDYHATDNA
ncbi:MAG: ATPase [Bacteroidaceae bacterium]|nr:ATPase [Bacteroidaceae bacterium]